MMRFLILAGLMVGLSAFPAHAADNKQADLGGMKIVDEAGEPVDVGGGSLRKFFTTFHLDSIPAQPKIKIGFALTSKGLCPMTYVRTTLWVNDVKIESIDFRRKRLGADKTIVATVPDGLLKVGENKFGIVGGHCQYDYDRIKLGAVELLS